MANLGGYACDTSEDSWGSIRAPVGTVPVCHCPDPVAPLLDTPRSTAPVGTGEFGIDVDAVTDVPLDWALCSGLRNLGNALARRLGTVLGALASDPNYGFDLRDMLVAGVDQSTFGAFRGQIVAEIEKDERVSAVSSIDFDFDDGTQQLAISIEVETALGPFSMVVQVASGSRAAA